MASFMLCGLKRVSVFCSRSFFLESLFFLSSILINGIERTFFKKELWRGRDRRGTFMHLGLFASNCFCF